VTQLRSKKGERPNVLRSWKSELNSCKRKKRNSEAKPEKASMKERPPRLRISTKDKKSSSRGEKSSTPRQN